MSIDIVVFFSVSATNRVELGRHFNELAAQTLNEPGCQRFELYEQSPEVGGFALVERWQDDSAISDHMGMPYTEHFIANAKHLIERSEVHRLTSLTRD
ncbi:antibiotic biosynthesis monooxygenase [Pseudomonas sp. SK3(2021)]|uniref:putative quinol monooxygenase n=1 Tax=Pseudomonas TaxID=286 RepID=UPI0015DF7BDB|nr:MULTISPECIES: antibiotic biosynthesis monooxygenase [Pseudomonas]QLL12289.1 antibiotic biosynthesis monooxygenase [Pseudomonas chlororaphis subsp. aurantiaca]QQZ41034.1 antibiotic biosynthesis monooxygenase [Pseudomonas sp. SK3(2021)]